MAATGRGSSPRASGRGRSPGEALRRAFRASHGQGRARSRPPAQSVHAQVRELVRSDRGYEMLRRAGVNPSQRTLVGWLTGDVTPKPENRGKIQEAYDQWIKSQARRVPDWARDAAYAIHGLIKTEQGGARERGFGSGSAPLVIEGSAGDEAGWDAIDDAYRNWLDPSDDEELWDLFEEHVIREDIDFSILEFPGDDYMIEIT